MQIPYEEVGRELIVFTSLILSSLVHFDVLAAQFDHVQDTNAIVSIFWGFEFNKSISSVLCCDLITGHRDIYYRTSLYKQLPNQLL